MIVVPTFTDVSAYIENVALGATVYRLRFGYNERDDSWYVDILTIDEQPIVEGRRIVVDFPLFDRFTDQRLFDGDLFAIDTVGKQLEPGRLDLGERVELVFATEDEIFAAVA